MVSSDNATQDHPLIVVVKKNKAILSWQIPLLVNGDYSGTLVYNSTSRTLCSTKYYNKLLSSGDDDEDNVTVSISTTSRNKRITFALMVKQIKGFYLKWVLQYWCFDIIISMNYREKTKNVLKQL